MYQITTKSSAHHGLDRLSVLFPLTALGLFAVAVGSAAGSTGRTGKVAKHLARHGARRSAPAGVVFGGVTSAGWPVVIQVSRDGREIVRATMAVPQQCQPSGAEANMPDYYTHVPISSTGAFQSSSEGSVSFTAVPGSNVLAAATGQLSGKFNQAGTSVTGKWSLVVVVRDASGATVDRCDSGVVSFTAVQ
jgi:hypothetical protein